MRKTKIPVQELWLKMGGGIYARGCIQAGFYGNIIIINYSTIGK